MNLIESALKYKDGELGDWKTMCIADGSRNASDIIKALQEVFPQYEYRSKQLR